MEKNKNVDIILIKKKKNLNKKSNVSKKVNDSNKNNSGTENLIKKNKNVVKEKDNIKKNVVNKSNKVNNKLNQNKTSICQNKSNIKKRKLKRKPIIILCSILLIITLGVITTIYFVRKDKYEKKLESERIALINDIKSHYGNYVKVNNDTVLYDKDNKEIGMLYKDIEVSLDEMEIDDKTKNFAIKDLGYISYKDVSPIDELTVYSNRYKSYIPFNKNVVTNNSYTLYSDDGNKTYTFNKEDAYPILIDNYENKYYVEYNNRLMYILKDDIKEIKNSNNSNKRNAGSVLTLLYHRIYDTKDKCTDTYICKKKSNFDNEMKYLKDNKYYSFTMEEMYLYLTKKLQVEKGIMITFDDGYLWDSAIEVLEKYDLMGSGFIITGRFKDFTVYDSPNFELHSHTNAMHTAGACNMGLQGGGILCKSEKDVLADLNKTRELLNNPIGFSYPFYDYSDRAINLVKKAGFKLSFIGTAGKKGKASPGSDVYKIPRMTIWDSTSFSTWKSYL